MAIFMFTDFGAHGPYLGQMEAVIEQRAPGYKVINLLSDAPVSKPHYSAYLLAALSKSFNQGSIFLCVVDPGVGGERMPVVLQAGDKFYVGPANGLFDSVAKHALTTQWYEIIYRPEQCSSSFHGRDIFAPVAAQLAIHQAESYIKKIHPLELNVAEDLYQIIYFDHYGNAFTGVRFDISMQNRLIKVGNHTITQANTFCKVTEGEAFWYKNSSGLIEIAVNKQSAKIRLGLQLGDEITFV